MNKWLIRSVLVVATLVAANFGALAQNEGAKGSLSCRDNWYSDRLLGHCEIKEQTVAPGGVITVDARRNGAVSVKGWNRNDILVRARIQTAASTQSEADELAKQVMIQTGGGKIFAEGPENRKDARWDVSYEIFAPGRSDLSLETYNGGISISDISGRIEFTGHNGGVSLKRVAGSVRGGTTNGGLSVELAGDRWDGETLDVKTTNGGIVVSVPENYSAHLEAGTVNGSLSIDFPVTVQGRITREVAVSLGAGGPTVRAMTTNGGVRIKRLGSGSNY